jgi:methionyl-tRNA formyltransferase
MINPKVIFAGTPEFAVASLRALVDHGVVPSAVLTQPDRPAGRGKRLTPSPVKQYALEQRIPIMQPASLRDAETVAELQALQPDIMVVAAYGLILPQAVLDIPHAGCLNVHASLLPRWRGAAPIQAAILAGDAETGVCLMSMVAGLDSGPVYVTEAVSIGEEETAGDLHDRLAGLGAALLVSHLGEIVDGELKATQQDEKLASYAPKIKTADAAMDWRRPAIELDRQVRAYNPVPGAWFMLDDVRIKCWKSRCSDGSDAPPGTVVAAGKGGIIVSCGDGALLIESLQRPGRRAVTAAEFSSQADLLGRVL